MMPGFVGPLSDLAGWTLSPVPRVEIPRPLRYGGYAARGLRAERQAAADILMAAPGFLRKPPGPAPATLIEIQVNPFRMREIVGALPFGLPTFYLAFDIAQPLAFNDGEFESEGAVLATARAVTIVMIGQDRIVRDPALWSREIAAATPATETGASSWRAFADAVGAALDAPALRPILVLDHAGQLAEDTRIVMSPGPSGEASRIMALAGEDHGDVRAAARRLGLPDTLFASDAQIRISQEDGGDELQFARIGDRSSAGGEIDVTLSERHIQVVNLHRWFAPQFAQSENQGDLPLARFSRGNRITPFINGPPYYNRFFELLSKIDGTGQGVHLTGGFLLEAEANLIGPDAADPNRPRTLKDALEAIAGNFPELEDGGGRFLSAKFIQIESTQTLSRAEIAAFYFLVGIIGVANLAKLGLDGLKTDASGLAILVILALGQQLFLENFIDEDAKPAEFMKDAVELLDNPAIRSLNKFSPLPSTVEDNPLAPSGFPFDTLFPFIRHFGLYHQKIAVIRNRDGLFGFCGGIDLSPNRLDTADHNVAGPYHDVHAMVEGRAAIDVATTFDQRWRRDGGAQPPAFRPAEITPHDPSPGGDIIQMARTYPKVDPSRRLDFAPEGDRTIADTTLRAIRAAREYIHIEDQYFTPPPEYVDAIVERIASGGLRKLIITTPTKSDQPFGDLVQADAIEAFRAAEVQAGAGAGEIIKYGVLRRHFTTPSSNLRAASGKLILGEDMSVAVNDTGFDDTILLGPRIRVPPPPFWLAVEGEIMWVYDEASVVIHGQAPENMHRFLVDRGQRTRLFGLGTGAKPRAHKKGAAATAIDLKGIFVHAKVILVDDVFAGIGSANVNRRGFYSDGEGHFFWMPEGLRTRPPAGSERSHNPIASLRHELWAEILNLPYPMAAPLLDDPVAAADLFDRLPIFGNRFVRKDAIPQSLSLGTFNGGDSIILNVLKALFSTIVQVDHKAIFEGVADPTTQLEFEA